MKYFVHESSYIDENVIIGEGTKIWFFCHVQSILLQEEKRLWNQDRKH